MNKTKHASRNIYKSTHMNYDCNKPFQQFGFFHIIFPNDYSSSRAKRKEKGKERRRYAVIKACSPSQPWLYFIIHILSFVLPLYLVLTFTSICLASYIAHLHNLSQILGCAIYTTSSHACLPLNLGPSLFYPIKSC